MNKLKLMTIIGTRPEIIRLSEVIKKEHFEIAIQKVSMENAIKSLKNILRMDFLESFEKINGVEELLRQDPANVYDRMDYKTKIAYRNSIQEIFVL